VGGRKEKISSVAIRKVDGRPGGERKPEIPKKARESRGKMGGSQTYNGGGKICIVTAKS